MKKIILDTNFLLLPHQFKVDIFGEIRRIANFKYKLLIVDKTMDELKKIMAEQKGKNKNAAVLGLVLLGHKGIYKIKTKKDRNVDELIMEEVEKGKKDYIVATQDAELKRKLKKKGVPVIVLRGKSHLGLVGA